MALTTKFFTTAIFTLVCLSHVNLHAQWTVISLHPAGQQSTEARGASGTIQVGNYYTGTERACLWSGTAESWVNLDPAGSEESMALGASAENQVGWADVAGRRRASLWSGTAASWVDLNPAGALQSQALGAWGGNQVGFMYDGAIGRASLWSGDVESWVDLHPADTPGSQASAVWGGNQVGWAVVDGIFHASLWSGTAESWVDLHPVGAFQSEAKGISEDYQVGIVDGHASLWSGTAASWVDLNPAGTISSELRAASGPLQVGAAKVDGWDHASVWSGTPESWVDLHALLSTDFRYSYALAVTSDGVNYYVAGLGYNTFEGRFEALLWTHAVLEAVCAGSGTLIEGTGETDDFNATCGSDDSYWAAHGSSLFFQISDPVVQFELTTTAPAGFGGSTISVDVEASKQNANGNLNLRALLFNFTTGNYVSLPGIMPLATTDAVQNFELPGGSGPADFIEPGTNEVRLLLQTIQTSGLPNVRTQLDEVLFNFE